MSASDRHEQLLAEMHQAMDEASRIVLSGGGRDEVFEAGCLVGVTVGIGLALANCIKERALCDAAEWAQAGHGTEYRRHLARAQAFEEIADALRKWSDRYRSESDVPAPDVEDHENTR
jgi:hypothetical protein